MVTERRRRLRSATDDDAYDEEDGGDCLAVGGESRVAARRLLPSIRRKTRGDGQQPNPGRAVFGVTLFVNKFLAKVKKPYRETNATKKKATDSPSTSVPPVRHDLPAVQRVKQGLPRKAQSEPEPLLSKFDVIPAIGSEATGHGSENDNNPRSQLSSPDGRERKTRSEEYSSQHHPAFDEGTISVRGIDYTVFRLLGRGGSSTVYEVMDEKRESYALKIVDFLAESIDNPFAKRELFKEIQYLNRLGLTRHVVRLVGFEHFEAPGRDELFLLMERGECDLLAIIRGMQRLTVAKLRFYWEQMLEAVQFIHRLRIIHADLKPGNFILVRGQVKLIDFGCAADVLPGHDVVRRSFLGGTEFYLSPESLLSYYRVDEEGGLLAGRSQFVVVGFKSDVWALGVILFQMVYKGSLPFWGVPGGRTGRIKSLMNLNKPVECLPLKDHSLVETLQLSLEKRLERRATVSRLLNHKFLKPGG